MLFRIAADAVLLLHLTFILFVLLGGLLVLRYRWLAWLHVPAVLWAAYAELTSRLCPLTLLENLLRRNAAQTGYSGGFIEHYLLPLIYPAGLTPAIQWWLGTGVIAINLLIYVWLVRQRR